MAIVCWRWQTLLLAIVCWRWRTLLLAVVCWGWQLVQRGCHDMGVARLLFPLPLRSLSRRSLSCMSKTPAGPGSGCRRQCLVDFFMSGKNDRQHSFVIFRLCVKVRVSTARNKREIPGTKKKSLLRRQVKKDTTPDTSRTENKRQKIPHESRRWTKREKKTEDTTGVQESRS